jgi:PAS domain S-box-containing protein
MKIDELTMRFNEPSTYLHNLYHLIDRQPLMLNPDSYVIDAIILMNQQQSQNVPLHQFNSSDTYSNINLQETGYVLVIESGHLLGIFTERELVKLAASTIDFTDIKITEVMQQPAITMKISDFQDIFTVLSLLHQYQIRHLPILNDSEQVVGIVTMTSLLQGLNQLQTFCSLQAFTHQSCNPIEWCNRDFSRQHQQGKVIFYSNMAEDITNLKQAEESLRRSETRLNLALESANMGIWDWDILTDETVWSANMWSLYGLPNTTLAPNFQGFLKLIHPQDREAFQLSITNIIEQGGQFAVEYRTVWPDGSIHWLCGKGQVYYNDAGQAIRMIGTTIDITDRKQSELALRESEEFYRSVVTAMSEGLVLQQADGKIITCNASAERILGLSREQIIGRTCDDGRWLTIHEDGSPFPSDEYPSMVTLLTGKPCSNVNMGIYKPDGQLTWVSINTQPLYRENETVPYAVVISFADISERQAAFCDRLVAEQKIREQAALLEIATDAIYVRDLHDEILFWNQGAERLYGWSKQEAIGRNARELLYTETSIHHNEQAFKVVTEVGVWQGELQKLTKHGKEVIVESRWTLMRDADEEAKSILIVDTDITHKKQLEEQFFRAQRLESLGTLASGIAHDLNNILTPILAAAQLLKVKLPNEQVRSATLGGTPSPKVERASSQYLLEILENNAKRGACLVKQVLSFARGFKGERITVQLKHLITDIILIGKQTFPKSIEFTASLPEDLWAVAGDVTQLHQVLMNLVVNARDAMPDGGIINITAENITIDETYASMVLEANVGNYIQVTVTDTGVGMASEILDKIFDPFFTTKDVGVGTGLGLSTVLGIIKSHGGFVTVSSTVGQGSKFTLFLPATQAMADIPTKEIEIPIGKGELILIVDDEPPICEIAKMILEGHDYNVLTAANGIEAIALYAQNKHRISAVVMDMMMPEMDGVTAIRTLKKMNSQVQIIASSGINVAETLSQAAVVGVQQVLPKPFTAKELLNCLHHLLRVEN